MYYLDNRTISANRAYADLINDDLTELIDKGGTCLFSHFTFRREPFTKDADFAKRWIVPLMLSLARQTQSIISPFVGWWAYHEDRRHQSHFHAAIHSNRLIRPNDVKKLWTFGMSEHKIFDIEKSGLRYIYGGHQRRDKVKFPDDEKFPAFFQKPFSPPKTKKTGALRPPFDSVDTTIRRIAGKVSQ